MYSDDCKGVLWFVSDSKVNYECLVFVQMNPFNTELKTRIVTKVCRHSDVRAEMLTVLCDYESTSESVACCCYLDQKQRVLLGTESFHPQSTSPNLSFL